MSSPYTGVHQFLATSKRIIEFCEGHSPEPKVLKLNKLLLHFAS